jgi:hypothetical protein
MHLCPKSSSNINLWGSWNKDNGNIIEHHKYGGYIEKDQSCESHFLKEKLLLCTINNQEQFNSSFKMSISFQ